MKTIAYDGVAAVTTDEVADALLELAITVARFSGYEAATVPVLVAGRVEQLTVMLGPTIHVSSVTGPDGDGSAIDGAAEAAASLLRLAKEYRDPLHGVEIQAVTAATLHDG